MPPLKRIDELRGLSDDHHSALVVAVRCQRAAAGTGDREPDKVWAEACEFFRARIKPHFVIEEKLLLPALRELGHGGFAERILTDHLRLRQLADLSDSSGDQLSEFADLLQTHIRFEERTVFEQTQHTLPAEVLEAIRDESRNAAKTCPTSL